MSKYSIRILWLLFLFNSLFLCKVKAQDLSKLKSTQNDIYSREKYISTAAKSFHIKPRILATIIFTERYLNYTFVDKELDFLLLDFGINASVGFAQVKPKTAKWIEKQLHNPNEKGYLGKDCSLKLPISRRESQLNTKLRSDSLNIMYAAAYIAIFIKMWEKVGKNISNNIAVLATLYSHGYINPEKLKVNSFGKNAYKFYYSKDILKKCFNNSL